MLSIGTGTKIFLAAEPTDMRKGFDALQGLVTGQLKKDPLSGHLFLFINRRRDKLKILYWDGDGLAIWYRRLEEGSYEVPKLAKDQQSAEIRSEDLTMLLRGIDFSSVRRRKRFAVADRAVAG